MSTQAVAVASGGTRWRRFVLAFGASFGAIGTVMVLMAMGVLALPITVSGTVFQVKADSLVAHANANGPAFIQYGAADQSSGPNFTGVAVTDLPAGGVLSNMDQVVCGVTGLGGLNPAWKYLVVELTADKADATGGLIVDATQLHANGATFDNIQIGVPAPNQPGVRPDGVGTFAQTADGVTIDGINQQAVYTQAGTFKITNLGLAAHLSATCPY